jgi:exosortase
MSTNGTISNRGGSLWRQRAAGLYLQKLPASAWALVITSLVLGLVYAPNFRDLYSTWNNDPNYSHGKLVVPIALFILWRRLSEPQVEQRSRDVPAPWWGWVFLAGTLAVRAIAYERNLQWVETATLVPAVACITWTFGGWPLMCRVWPAIVFLVFLLPLPGAVNELMAIPLQSIAAVGSCFLLQLSGFWAIREGNVINLGTPHGSVPLDIALACNGLRMLMTMAATIVATIILISMPTWKRLTLLASTIPIALLSNMLRIVVTGWCYYVITGPEGKARAHDYSGLLMMPLALILVGLELQLLSWLVPDKSVQDSDDQKLVIPLINVKAAGKKPRQNADLDELS